VRSYTNTGVVHIIAISGMHLALIYGILVLITSPLKKIKTLKTFRILIIIAGLWIFSIMAGAQASVLRSALMFTCIAVAELAERKTSVYNSLAVSALILLCYNPFWIWDLGFQLSFAAVLGILVFYKSIYNWISFQNRLVDTIWKTLAVSIAAQILTTPISLYYFHQFPVLFLFTNLLAVPLSTLILLGLIFLCFFSWWFALAKISGLFCSLLITWMNSYIENLEKIPFALWSGFSLSLFQAWLLLFIMFSMAWFLWENYKPSIYTCLVCSLIFISIRSASFYKTGTQRKIIVYNSSGRVLIDCVKGRQVFTISNNSFIKNEIDFVSGPARILYRLIPDAKKKFITRDLEFMNKKILILDKAIHIPTGMARARIDILIVAGNARINIQELIERLDIKLILIHNTVPEWKAKTVKKTCDALRIPRYDLVDKGAFVMKL
jgi:competence protein ComEC